MAVVAQTKMIGRATVNFHPVRQCNYKNIHFKGKLRGKTMGGAPNEKQGCKHAVMTYLKHKMSKRHKIPATE